MPVAVLSMSIKNKIETQWWKGERDQLEEVTVKGKEQRAAPVGPVGAQMSLANRHNANLIGCAKGGIHALLSGAGWCDLRLSCR